MKARASQVSRTEERERQWILRASGDTVETGGLQQQGLVCVEGGETFSVRRRAVFIRQMQLCCYMI